MARLFGLTLHNLTMPEALDRLTDGRPCTVHFVNAHAARLAAASNAYRGVIGRADLRLVDGIGVRLALLMRGERLRANLVGTDLVPALLRASAGRCFLFGGTEAINHAAAAHIEAHYPDWRVAGRQHGYLAPAEHHDLVARMNASGADLLLVGLGNPLQEEWLDRHADALRPRLRLAVGGLFHHWAGDLVRAPAWMRRAGLEWVQLCVQKPRRAARYATDIPIFLARAVLMARSERA